MLSSKVDIPLDNFSFWLQNTNPLEPTKNLVDQCIQGEGLVQINCQVNPRAQMINIVDILKPTDDVLASSSSSSSSNNSNSSSGSRKKLAVDQQLAGSASKRAHDNSNSTSTVNGSKSAATVPVASKNKNWAIDNAFKREQLRLKIPDNPVAWTKPNVRFWLQWAMRQFNEASISPEDWDIDGDELCKITLEQFNEKVPVDPGNFFWTHLELLRKCKYVAVQHKNGPPASSVIPGSSIRREKSTRISTTAVTSTPPQVPQQEFTTTTPTPMPENIRPLKVMGRTGGRTVDYSSGNRSGSSGQIQLWQFLLDILTDVEHRDVIQWEGVDGQFKLIDAERVAQLWGIRKNKPNMNYEKLSRALRYYYDGDMLAKVAGKRFVYQFVCNLQQLIGYDARELAMLVNEQS